MKFTLQSSKVLSQTNTDLQNHWLKVILLVHSTCHVSFKMVVIGTLSYNKSVQSIIFS